LVNEGKRMFHVERIGRALIYNFQFRANVITIVPRGTQPDFHRAHEKSSAGRDASPKSNRPLFKGLKGLSKSSFPDFHSLYRVLHR
jgi:hypothetical protein